MIPDEQFRRCKCGAIMSMYARSCIECVKKQVAEDTRRIMGKVESGKDSTFIEKSQPKEHEWDGIE